MIIWLKKPYKIKEKRGKKNECSNNWEHIV